MMSIPSTEHRQQLTAATYDSSSASHNHTDEKSSPYYSESEDANYPNINNPAFNAELANLISRAMKQQQQYHHHTSSSSHNDSVLSRRYSHQHDEQSQQHQMDALIDISRHHNGERDRTFSAPGLKEDLTLDPESIQNILKDGHIQESKSNGLSRRQLSALLGRYECPYCQKRYRSQGSFAYHKKHYCRMNPKREPFRIKCPNCDRVYSSPGALHNHQAGKFGYCRFTNIYGESKTDGSSSKPKSRKRYGSKVDDSSITYQGGSPLKSSSNNNINNSVDHGDRSIDKISVKLQQEKSVITHNNTQMNQLSGLLSTGLANSSLIKNENDADQIQQQQQQEHLHDPSSPSPWQRNMVVSSHHHQNFLSLSASAGGVSSSSYPDNNRGVIRNNSTNSGNSIHFDNNYLSSSQHNDSLNDSRNNSNNRESEQFMMTHTNDYYNHNRYNNQRFSDTTHSASQHRYNNIIEYDNDKNNDGTRQRGDNTTFDNPYLSSGGTSDHHEIADAFRKNSSSHYRHHHNDIENDRDNDDQKRIRYSSHSDDDNDKKIPGERDRYNLNDLQIITTESEQLNFTHESSPALHTPKAAAPVAKNVTGAPANTEMSSMQNSSLPSSPSRRISSSDDASYNNKSTSSSISSTPTPAHHHPAITIGCSTSALASSSQDPSEGGFLSLQVPVHLVKNWLSNSANIGSGGSVGGGSAVHHHSNIDGNHRPFGGDSQHNDGGGGPISDFVMTAEARRMLSDESQRQRGGRFAAGSSVREVGNDGSSKDAIITSSRGWK